MRAERAKLKSLWDDMKIAWGKRSAALGYGREKGVWVEGFFAQGGGLGGLALG